MGHSITLWHYFFKVNLATQCILLILGGFSLYSWIIFVQRFFFFRALKQNCTKFEKSFWSNINLVELYEQLPEPLPAENLNAIFYAGFSEFCRLNNSSCNDFKIVLQGVSHAMNIAELQAKVYLTKQLNWLRLIINSAPLLGLTGTLLGIAKTLSSLNEGVELNALLLMAPGIGEAFIASVFSLIVALSALIFYYINEHQCHQLLSQYRIFQEEFLTLLLRQSYEEQHERKSV